jgi:maltose O-acetyltransferase
MTEKEYMLKGMLYLANDDELKKLVKKKDILLLKFNNELNINKINKQTIIKKLFGSIGNNSWVNPPFRCDYGFNIHVGNHFYANYDCIFLDVNKITIGNNVFIAPRVCIYTAGHPIDKDIRNEELEYGYPVTIGNDVWIGGNVVINPGVTIGDNVVIGSGSIVTKDIESNCIAAGNPCKKIRDITDVDKKYWQSEAKKHHTHQ